MVEKKNYLVVRFPKEEKNMDAKELLNRFYDAKAALWDYLSTHETTYLHLDITDLRDEEWNGMADSSLRWGWNSEEECWNYPDALERDCLEIKSVTIRDGLTFIWYNIAIDESSSWTWVVFANDNVRDGS